MIKSHLWGALSAVVFSFITLPSHASLISVLGGQAYYDDVADLTWLANANAGAGSMFDDGGTDTLSMTDGKMTWASANAWAANLNIDGVTGWRLPNTNPIDGTTADDNLYSYIGSEDRGYNVSAPDTIFAGSLASEMANLFYNTLGNKGKCDPILSESVCTQQSGWGLTNTGPFVFPTRAGGYWSATEYEPTATDSAWGFYFNSGNQLDGSKSDPFYAWAVYSGNVNAVLVPIPAALWLFGSGLVGLIGVARRKVRV